MERDQSWWFRLAVLATLVKRSRIKPGRTVLMKYAYLLQTIRRVPLGYRFVLYNYGPFDSAVLSDLSQAKSLEAIESQVIAYPGGYGYEYSPAHGYDELFERSADELKKCDEDLNWVIERFGRASASELELYSTIVFANRETRRKGMESTADELNRKVRQIKPYFTEQIVAKAIDDLSEDGLVELADD